MTTSGTATHDGPGAAFDSFLADVAPSSRTQERWTAGDAPLPALFLGHGAPPLFDDAKWIAQLFAWSTSLPKPRAILMVSAHWEAAPMSLVAGSGNGPDLRLRRFRRAVLQHDLPTPDASEAGPRGDRFAARLGIGAPHPSRGLDHGAWVPLKVMYPFGDVPVLQLSLPPTIRSSCWARPTAAATAGLRRADHRFRLPSPMACRFSPRRCSSAARSPAGHRTSTAGPPTPWPAARWTS